MVKLKIILVLLSLFFLSSIKAQTENGKDADQEFKIALNFYDTKNYNDALQLFDRLIKNRALNSRTTAAFLFKGKTLLQLKKYDEAISTLNQFLNIYPGSKYADEARMVITKCYLQENNYLNAFEEVNFIISSGNSSAYISQAKSIAEQIGVNYITPVQLRNLYDNSDSEKLKPFLLLLVGKAYLNNGNTADGLSAFSEVQNIYPNTPESSEAKEFYNAVKNKRFTSASALIGVMLPLFANNSNDSKTPAAEILEGIKFAASQFNRSHKEKIGLIIRDTGRDKDKIKDIANEFKEIPSLKTVIGPVFSDEVQAAIDAFSGSDIKIISPTATDNDLAESNNNIYQANPSFAVRGKTMADYIYYIEKKKKMGVINSNTGYSTKLAEAFINEFEKLGGTILSHQEYPVNSVEITRQISNMLPFSNSLEGLYAPISDKNDATVILSSLVLDSLYLPMFGNQDWFLAKGMETSTTLSNNLTMTSDYFINFSDQKFKELSKRFFSANNSDLNRNVLYGYDTADYLLQIIFESKNDPDKIRQLMDSGKTVIGIHNNILFDENHVNKYLNIIRYNEGVYRLIQRFNSLN